MRTPAVENSLATRDTESILMQYAMQSLGAHDDCGNRMASHVISLTKDEQQVPYHDNIQDMNTFHFEEVPQVINLEPTRRHKPKPQRRSKPPAPKTPLSDDKGNENSCCILGCSRLVTTRLRFSLKCDYHKFKEEHISTGQNKVCDHHYYSDLYEHKKASRKVQTALAGRVGKKSNSTARRQNVKKIINVHIYPLDDIPQPQIPQTRQPEEEEQEPQQPPESDEEM